MNKEKKLDTIEMTRGYIGVILMAILMATGVVSGMYSGESYSFETNLTNPVYTVIGNTSTLEGLTVEFSNGNLTISSDPLMATDNFTMVFFDEVTKEIEKITYRGGGGSSSRTRYVDKNVTVYVPEYINITQEVEVDKIVDIRVHDEETFKLWHLILGVVVGIGFGAFMFRKKKEETING